MKKVKLYISLLKDISLTKYEQNLLEINLLFLDSRYKFIKEIGKQGIISLMEQINYRIFIQQFLNSINIIIV